MSRTIGICRALHAFDSLVLWQTFLEHLRLDVVVSGPTDRDMVESGARVAPAELCLPAKVFLGHALALRGKVERLFVPRMVCWKADGDRFYGCPKAMALPDMTRALVPELAVVELCLDEREGTEERAFRTLARDLGDGRAWRGALAAAREAQAAAEPAPDGEPAQAAGPRIGVIGHSYLLRDDALSLGLAAKMRRAGAVPVLSDRVRILNTKTPSRRARVGGKLGHLPISVRRRRAQGTSGCAMTCRSPVDIGTARKWGGVPFFPNWWFELELIDAAAALAADPGVEGLVLASSFACGTSPVTNDIIRRMVRVRRPGMPVMEVFFDEHSAEAGLVTRVESFCDLLRMRGPG